MDESVGRSLNMIGESAQYGHTDHDDDDENYFWYW